MLLAQKLAGFTPGESDKMRKTLVKKDLTSLGKKVTEKEELRKKFIKGAVEVGGMPKRDAEELFEKIAFFSLYGFNKSHAVAYAIASYYGAWLMTHYEHEWLSTCLQSENSNVKKLPVMISEIKKLGYKFADADVNLSSRTWTYSKQAEALVPPLSSFKGVGDAAMQEILENRPYRNLDELLYNDDGTWKHSKMNKRCFAALTKMEAFASLEEFGVGILRNHRQMHDLIIENYDVLKKNRYGMSIRKARKIDAPSQLPSLIESTKQIEDWSRVEKISNFAEIGGTVNEELVFPSEVMAKIDRSEIPSLPSISGNMRTIAWGCLQDIIKKTSKNGKTFYRIKVIDPQSNYCWLRVWGNIPPTASPYTIWIFDVTNNEQWGASTNSSKMRPVVV